MTTPLRIAYVINSLESGGAQSLLIDFVKRLDKSKIAPYIVYLKNNNAYAAIIQKEQIRADYVKLSMKLPTDELKNLSNYFKENAIQIVHAHTDTASFAARVAGVFHPSAYYISHYHNNYERRVNQDYIELETLLGPYTDAYVGCSETVTNFMVNRLNLNRFPLITIMNGIDLLPFLQTTISQNKIREKLNISTSCFHLVHVARLKTVKRPDRIIDIMAHAIRTEQSWMNNFRLTYLGDGDQREQMQTLIKLYDKEFSQKGLPLISQKIVFAGTCDNIPEWLSAADAFVLLSDMEGLPISVIEALASGLPCLVTNIEPMKPLIKHGENGFLIEPDNKEQGVDYLGRMVKDKLMQKMMHHKAASSAQRFSVDHYINETLKLYETLQESPKKMKKMGFFKRRHLLTAAQNHSKGIYEKQQENKLSLRAQQNDTKEG